MDAAQAAIKNFEFIGVRIRIEFFRSSKGKVQSQTEDFRHRQRTGNDNFYSRSLHLARSVVSGMMIHILEQEQFLPISLKQAWDFFSSPRNLDEITPKNLGFKILYQPGEVMYEGQIIEYKVKIAPGVWVPWVTEIKCVRENQSFIDEQRFGPYKFWHHLHHFEEVEGGVLMRDLVHYALPLWPFGEIGHSLFVRPKLETIFSFRREILDKRFNP